LKQLYIIRHAKSDQGFWGSDFDRPLNERGKSDALVMAKRLKDKQAVIDAWVASPARRAKKTAEAFAEVFKSPADDIIFVSELYQAPQEVFYDVISQLPDNFDSVAVFSHNPGITYFVNTLVPGVRTDNMPTCAIFAIRADIEHWREFADAEKEFLFFDYPKKSP